MSYRVEKWSRGKWRRVHYYGKRETAVNRAAADGTQKYPRRVVECIYLFKIRKHQTSMWQRSLKPFDTIEKAKNAAWDQCRVMGWAGNAGFDRTIDIETTRVDGMTTTHPDVDQAELMANRTENQKRIDAAALEVIQATLAEGDPFA